MRTSRRETCRSDRRLTSKITAMIKITGISLADFGRHKKVGHKISGNVVGLCGPNGMGKSTVLQALQFALTGTIDHPDPLRDFIRREAGDKAPKSATVTVDFVADGKAGRITRKITASGSTRKLEWDGIEGGKALTSDKQVTDLLYEILGVDRKAINSTVFIRQGEMASMFGKDSERRDFYTRLLMLGHMAKVADVIETYRKQTADTLQDLSTVKDAAESSYAEATAFLSECDRELAAMPKVGPEVDHAGRLMLLFGVHSDSEDAAARAGQMLRTAVGSDEDPEAWIAEREKSSKDARESLDLLAAARRRYTDARAELHTASDELSKMKESASLYDAADKISSELGALKLDISDPTEKITELERTSAKLERRAELRSVMSDGTKKAEVDDLAGKVNTLEDNVQSLNASYDEAREAYRKTKSDLQLRETLQAELQAVQQGTDSACCPVCGAGAEHGDASFLASSVASLRTQLEESRIAGEKAAARLKAAKEELTAAQGKLAGARTSYDADAKELQRLDLELLTCSEESVSSQLLSARETQRLWSAQEFERRRLVNALKDAEARLPRTARPSAEALREAETRVSAATVAAGLHQWSDEQDARETALRGEIAELDRQLRSASQAVAGHKAAMQQRAKAREELGAAVADPLTDKVLAMLPNRVRGSVVTADEVETAASALRARQSDYDTAAGRRKGAEESVRSASRRIDEIDLRMAEQRHRRKLADDLARLRDTFKPSGASLEYIDYKFGQIARLAADYLAESQADFMVVASETQPLAYEFIRTDRADEVWMPQSRMSGGQQVRLAVATLRAIHGLIMPNVGLLVLDEPTTHLDDDAKRDMAEMLHKIGDEGTLQMVVCDHSPALIDAFSDVVDITGHGK